MIAVLVILGIALVLSFIPALVIFLRVRRRFSGRRIVTCPETGRVAAIRLDAGHAAMTSLTGDPELKVEGCTRWDGPVGHCFEGCIREVETPPVRQAESA